MGAAEHDDIAACTVTTERAVAEGPLSRWRRADPHQHEIRHTPRRRYCGARKVAK